MKKTLVAVLDDRSRYIGTKLKAKPTQDDFLLPNGCDLPTDGSYKLVGNAFVPLGHGFGKPMRAPVSTEAVLNSLIQAMTDLAPDAVPHEARVWAEWYQKNLKAREDEGNIAHDLRAVRGTGS